MNRRIIIPIAMCENYQRGPIYVDEIPEDPYKFDDNARKRFMELLAETGRIFHACKSVGISTTYIYQRRKIDDELSNDMDEALGVYKDTLEAEMYRRAVEGVVENKYHQGLPILDYELDEDGQVILDENERPKIVGQAHIRRYSDTLLLAHARRHIPEYNEKRTTDVNVRGLDGLLAEITDKSGDLPSVDEKLDDE